MKALSPKECIEAQKNMVPDWVIEIFNNLLKKMWDGVEATIYESDVKKEIENRGYKYINILNSGMLKIAPIYEAQGWEIKISPSGSWWEFKVRKGC